jgi:hypothetical protein
MTYKTDGHFLVVVNTCIRLACIVDLFSAQKRVNSFLANLYRVKPKASNISVKEDGSTVGPSESKMSKETFYI